MPRWDPAVFLDSIGVEYTTARGNYIFACPWCGDSDLKGDNYGIRVDGTRWGCWRNRAHGGGLQFVLRTLSGWTSTQVAAYLGEGLEETSPISELRKRAAALSAPKTPVGHAEAPPADEFRVPLATGPTARFWAYLAGRGFDDVAALCARYRIRCALTGKFCNRVILPIFESGRAIGWTARAIGEAKLRYIAEPEGAGIKDAVYNSQLATGGKVLVIVEGPVDALKLDFYGYALGVSAVALMGTAATPAQTAVLLSLAERYERVVILLDTAAAKEARDLRKQLPTVGAIIWKGLGKWKDPGELPKEACLEVLGRLLQAA